MLRFGSLDFVVTGNGYDTPTPPPRRRRRSDQRARQVRMEWRREARLSSPAWVETGMSQPGATARDIAASPPPSAAPVLPKEDATAPLPFPFGMRNVAATYASSVSTNMSAYEDLPGHHLISIRNLIASSPDDSYPDTAGTISDDINFFMDNFTAPEWDYSGVRDLDAFRSFQLAATSTSPAPRTPARGITIPLGSVSWSSWRTGWSMKR